MATITPTLTGAYDKPIEAFWETLTENDTAAAWEPQRLAALIAGVQVTGTFGSATVVLEGSWDGTNYVTLKDTAGNDVSLTAAGAAEFSTTAKLIRPAASGGTSQDVDITIIARGNQ